MDDETVEEREAARQKALASAQPTCPYCGAFLDRHQAISPGHCGGPSCLARHFSKVSETRDAERIAERQDKRDIARKVAADTLNDAAALMGADAERMLIAPVPFQDGPVRALPPERRAAFEAHLDDILARAFEAPDTMPMTLPPTNPAEEPPIVDAACAACQGLCCRKGGGSAHAFLTPQTVVYLLRADPDLTAEELRQTYLDALPERSVAGSCVYQSDEGCTLSREFRASLCNRFYCHDLYALHDQTGGQSDLAVALVAMDNDTPRKVIAFDARLGGIVMSEKING